VYNIAVYLCCYLDGIRCSWIIINKFISQDRGVVLEDPPLLKFIRNYIRDPSGGDENFYTDNGTIEVNKYYYYY